MHNCIPERRFMKNQSWQVMDILTFADSAYQQLDYMSSLLEDCLNVLRNTEMPLGYCSVSEILSILMADTQMVFDVLEKAISISQNTNHRNCLIERFNKVDCLLKRLQKLSSSLAHQM